MFLSFATKVAKSVKQSEDVFDTSFESKKTYKKINDAQELITTLKELREKISTIKVPEIKPTEKPRKKTFYSIRPILPGKEQQNSPLIENEGEQRNAKITEFIEKSKDEYEKRKEKLKLPEIILKINNTNDEKSYTNSRKYALSVKPANKKEAIKTCLEFILQKNQSGRINNELLAPIITRNRHIDPSFMQTISLDKDKKHTKKIRLSPRKRAHLPKSFSYMKLGPANKAYGGISPLKNASYNTTRSNKSGADFGIGNKTALLKK